LESDEANTLIARYTHGAGIDEPLIMERDLDASGVFETGEVFFYHADGLGSVAELTDSAGAMAQAYLYDSFGQIVDEVGVLENPYTYTGREFDPESGLYHYRQRTYDPSVGRFLSEDSIKFLGGLNFYTYVSNNPIRFQDPSGQHLGVAIGAGIGFVSGFTGALAQNGNFGEAMVGGLSGALFGAAVGFLDPTGIAAGAALGALAGAGGNTLGQGLTNFFEGRSILDNFDLGSLVGATIGGSVSGGMGVVMGRAFNAVPKPVDPVTKFGAGLIGLSPSALGGPIGSAFADPERARGSRRSCLVRQ